MSQVIKIVRAIRNGWIKPRKDEKTDKPRYYLIWDKDDTQVNASLMLASVKGKYS